MAYITTDDVRVIRNNLKDKFPKFKFSVRRGYRGSSVEVTILSGPVRFGDGNHVGINHYHLGNYKNNDILQGMLDIINFKNYDKSNAMYDHFDVGYYVDLKQGGWNRAYEVK